MILQVQVVFKGMNAQCIVLNIAQP